MQKLLCEILVVQTIGYAFGIIAHLGKVGLVVYFGLGHRGLEIHSMTRFPLIVLDIAIHGTSM